MTINDMSVLLAAIDLAVKRGAFSILEIQQVGAVAEKLNSFIADAKQQVEQSAKVDEAATSTESVLEKAGA